MQLEERMEGGVRVNIYSEFLRKGGGWCAASAVLLLHMLCTCCMVGSTLWVGFWTDTHVPCTFGDDHRVLDEYYSLTN